MTSRSYSHGGLDKVPSAKQLPPPEPKQVTTIDLARMAGVMEARQNLRPKDRR